MAVEAKRKRADFREKRQLDSGVWMGSDGSSSECLLSSEASSCDDFLASDRAATTTTTTAVPVMEDGNMKEDADNGHDRGPTVAARNLPKQDESKEHQAARSVVNDCLDKGQESIDLRYVLISIVCTAYLLNLFQWPGHEMSSTRFTSTAAAPDQRARSVQRPYH